ncbi:hypothetical protein [Actinosynnema sp.]|uniref:hypothetical protein n=1 Tax=Actinosynnema sp. TaxID=1872144 RepID=UPI003F83D7EE
MPSAPAPALQALHLALDALPPPAARQGAALGNWRWTVRQRLAAVRELLISGLPPVVIESPDSVEGDRVVLLRQRNTLLERLHALDPQILQSPHPDVVRRDLMRLLIDVDGYARRLESVRRPTPTGT